MMRKIPRNDAYKILRSLVDVPCENAREEEVAQKRGSLTPGRRVDQMQAYADIANQTVEMERRCRAAGPSAPAVRNRRPRQRRRQSGLRYLLCFEIPCSPASVAPPCCRAVFCNMRFSPACPQASFGAENAQLLPDVTALEPGVRRQRPSSSPGG